MALLLIASLTTSWVFLSVTALTTPEVWQPASPPVEIPSRAPGSILQASLEGVNVYATYSHEPAPMGIADYGIGPNGPYQYATNSSLGSAYIASLSTANSSGYSSMSIQLNIILQFSANGKQYVYWAQDVVQIDTSSRLVYFLDNIWNFSAYKANMAGPALSGNGQVYPSGATSYYAARAGPLLPGNGVQLSYPASVDFEINATVTSSNQPQLTFGYNDGFGWRTYDTVVFKTTGKVALHGFEVNGFNGNPGGNFYDSELVLGGVCCGYQTSDVSSDVRLQLEYWNGHNYQIITNAYNFGSDTAEGIQNTQSQWYYYPADGGLIAEMRPGAGTLAKLWDQSGIGIVDMKPGVASGVFYVKNASNPSAVASQYPFTNGEVIVALQPGYYQLSVYRSGTLFSNASYSLGAGQTLHLSFPITKVPVTLSYSVVGGGSGYSPPILTYTSNGQVVTSVLGTTPTTFSVDTGSSWTITSTLLGSSSTERWSTLQAVSGTASSAQTINLVYYHQFYLSVTGGSVSSQWYDSVSTALVTTPGVYGRSSGVGFRIESYTIDGGTTTPVNPTTGNLTVPIIMNGPHTLAFNAIKQEEIMLDPGATEALNTITQPTISGDNYWYDSGLSVQVALNGIWGRSSGTGSKLGSYSVNGGPATAVATVGTVIVLSLPQISSPQSITAVSTSQFFLSTPTGSLASVSPTPISGDSGWYDSGTAVKASYHNVWNIIADGSRLSAISYTVDAGTPSVLPRSGNGTFTVTLTMGRPHTISVKAVMQYHLATSGGSNVRISVPSPTGDDFFDAGTSLALSTDYSWNAVNGNTRLNLVSYTLNGQTLRIARMDSGIFLTPSINLTRPTELMFDAVPQYFVSFFVTDELGATQIAPTSFRITVNGSVQPVRGSGMWFDSKSLVGVASIIWESAEVKPTAQNLSTITGPRTITIRALVFPAELAVSDFLGFPVSGANVEVRLANDTVVSGTTDSNGILNLGLIPIGTFQASVANLGFTTQISGDATNREVVPGRIAASYPTLTVTITAVVVISVFLVAIMVRRSRTRKSRRGAGRQGATLGRQSNLSAR